MRRFGEAGEAAVLSLLIGVFFVVSGLAVLLSVSLITPSNHTARKGLRRVRKLGIARVPLAWDAATSWPATTLMIVWVFAGYALVLAALHVGSVYDWTRALNPWLAVLPVLGLMVVAAYQGMSERFGQRAVILGLFVCWVVPVMVMIVMMVAFDTWRAAMYIGGLCPAVAGALSLAGLLDAAAGPIAVDRYLLQQTPAEPHAHRVIVLTLILYAGVAVLGQLLRWRGSRRLRRRESVVTPSPRPPAPPAPAAG
jgi:uncharacterized membrane protein